MNSEVLCAELKAYHGSFSSKTTLLNRQSYYEIFRDMDAYCMLQSVTDDTFCNFLSQEIACLRSSSFIVEGRSRCSLFQPSSSKIPSSKDRSSRCKLLDRARNTPLSFEFAPVFVGLDVFSVGNNKQAAIFCYRLPSTDLRQSFLHLLCHPIFGTRDKSTRIHLDSSSCILWITVLWTGHEAPIGVDVLKLAHLNNPASTISSPLNSISTISNARPQEFHLSSSEQSPCSQESWDSTLGRIHEELDNVQAKLLLRIADQDYRQFVVRE